MKIVDISHYYTSPPLAGGQLRIYNLNRHISYHNRVDQFSFTPAMRKKDKKIICKGYTEHIYPVVRYQAGAFFLSRLLNMPFDFPIPYLFNRLHLPSDLNDSLLTCDAVIIEHPWLYRWVRNSMPKRQRMILVAHNVEYDLQREGLFHLPRILQKKILRCIKNNEKYACRDADRIVCVSEEDKSRLVELYGIKGDKIFIVPNGVDEGFGSSLPGKSLARMDLGIPVDAKVVLFAGAGHPPNSKAADHIMRDIAKQCPDFFFLIAGSVSKRWHRGNVMCTGPVKDILPYFSASDIAINPMTSGSGTNIKILEYLAAGLPIITTSFGGRGYDSNVFQISDIDAFALNIRSLFNDSVKMNQLRKNGLAYAKGLTWQKNAKKMEDVLLNSNLNS